jgi:hypothetical protein
MARAAAAARLKNIRRIMRSLQVEGMRLPIPEAVVAASWGCYVMPRNSDMM